MIVGAASQDVAIAFVEIGAIVIGLAVLARLSDRMGISPIPAYLLAGLVFGDGGIAAPVLSADFLELAGEIGVVLLLLTLGLEYTPRSSSTALRTGSARRRPRRHAQRDARGARRTPARLGPGGGRPARRHHLHLVVRRDREAAQRPRASRQPRDACHPHDPRPRGPRDGGVPTDRRRDARRRGDHRRRLCCGARDRQSSRSCCSRRCGSARRSPACCTRAPTKPSCSGCSGSRSSSPASRSSSTSRQPSARSSSASRSRARCKSAPARSSHRCATCLRPSSSCSSGSASILATSRRCCSRRSCSLS